MQDQTRKKKRLIRALLTIASLPLLASCRTLPEPEPEPVPVEVVWPVFPDPMGKVSRSPDGVVMMPTEYWLEITNYVIEVERAKALIKSQ